MNNNAKRTTKEYKLLGDSTNIKSKYGTLDKSNPEIIYIRSKATITPVLYKKDFSDDIVLIKKSFEQSVKESIRNTNDFEDKHICTIEMSENGISYGKKSHVKYDVYLKPKVVKPITEYHNTILRLAYIFNKGLEQSLLDKNIRIE